MTHDTEQREKQEEQRKTHWKGRVWLHTKQRNSRQEGQDTPAVQRAYLPKSVRTYRGASRRWAAALTGKTCTVLPMMNVEPAGA